MRQDYSISCAAFAICVALAIGCAVWTGAANAATIQNGSFDNTLGTFTPNGQDADSLGVGSTIIPGWTVVNNEIAWISIGNPWSETQSPGNASNFWLDLTGYHDSSPPGGITQTITTVPGEKYSLQFDLGSSDSYNAPSQIIASAGSTSGTFTTSLSGQNNWETETLLFIASGTSTVITIFGGLVGSQVYIGLDNVRLTDLGPTATPLPAALSLFVTGLSALGLVGWRKRKKAEARAG